MDVEHLIGTMIEGTLAGRRKRSRGARRFLRNGSSSFLNASTLLTVGGLVWGVIETMQQQSPGGPGPAPASGPVPAGGPTAAPPLCAPPPLPGAAIRPAAAIPDGAARLVRLMVSAARADGELTETERGIILEHARAVEAESLVADEIAHPTALKQIVEGIADRQQRADLYVLAYGIVRADESVSGAEQIYLAQLGALLDLDRPTLEGLEREAAARIEQAAQGEEASTEGSN